MIYARLSLARKERYGAKGTRTHPGASPRPSQPREFICLECRVRVPHAQAAAHASRCRGSQRR